MILQCIPKEKFTRGFIDFTNDAFDEKDVIFAVYGQKEEPGYEPSTAGNVVAFGAVQDMLASDLFRALAANSKGIVVNWVNLRLVNGLRVWRDKTWLMFWGGDLYPYLRAGHKSPKQYLRRAMLICALKNFGGAIAISEADKERLVFLGANRDFILDGSMCGMTKTIAIRNSSEACAVLRTPKPSEPYRILLGNSATRTNRHFQAIQLLSKYRQANMKVYVPLSYGDESYGLEVAEYGRERLGDQFVPIFDYMNEVEYGDLLASVSVGVFNNDRQQALGNISILMKYGAKIYIAYDNPIKDEYLSMGTTLYYVDDIEQTNFEDFVFYDESGRLSNSRIWSPLERYNRAVSRWSEIYQRIEFRAK